MGRKHQRNRGSEKPQEQKPPLYVMPRDAAFLKCDTYATATLVALNHARKEPRLKGESLARATLATMRRKMAEQGQPITNDDALYEQIYVESYAEKYEQMLEYYNHSPQYDLDMEALKKLPPGEATRIMMNHFRLLYQKLLSES